MAHWKHLQERRLAAKPDEVKETRPVVSVRAKIPRKDKAKKSS